MGNHSHALILLLMPATLIFYSLLLSSTLSALGAIRHSPEKILATTIIAVFTQH